MIGVDSRLFGNFTMGTRGVPPRPGGALNSNTASTKLGWGKGSGYEQFRLSSVFIKFNVSGGYGHVTSRSYSEGASMAADSRRIHAIDSVLTLVAADKYVREDLSTRLGSGDVGVRYRPRVRGAAELIVTDTGVSWYMEVTAAKWESDSGEHLGDEEAWAIATARNLACNGAIRVRPINRPWGRETIIPTSRREMDALSSGIEWKVIHVWSPW